MNYLIVGASYKLIDAEIQKIVLNRKYKVYSLLDTSLNEILTDASYTSLFDEEKIIIVKNFESIIDKKNDDLESLNNYLNDTINTTLILISNTNIPSKSKLNKDIISKLRIIETKNPTKPYEISALILLLAENYNLKIIDNALSLFTQKCAYNIDIAIMELEKLKLIKTNNIVSLEDVKTLVPNYNADDIFELKDAIISRDIKRAEELILEAEAAKLEIIPIIVMLAKEYELLYAIKELAEEKRSNEEIGVLLRNMHPYRIKILRQSASKYKQEELKRILLCLCNIDLKCVSEDNLGFLELKKFLLEL